MSDKHMYLRDRQDTIVDIVFRGEPWQIFPLKNKDLIKC